ncbi:hypothetical protein B7494_g1419 [Chlorociboria aeruginascens]|nr:hypothetical protein B7494_g1419 [Chlorociboria aeruginascens]
MQNLQGYIHGGKHASPQRQINRPDRELIRDSLRVSNRKSSASVNGAPQPLASAAPNSGYQHSLPGGRNTLSHPQYAHVEYATAQKSIFECSTIESDFDMTESEVTVGHNGDEIQQRNDLNGEDEYDDDQSFPQQQLELPDQDGNLNFAHTADPYNLLSHRNKHTQSLHVNYSEPSISPQISGISGRFAKSGNFKRSDFSEEPQHRQNKSTPGLSQENGPRKRGRSTEPRENITSKGIRPQQKYQADLVEERSEPELRTSPEQQPERDERHHGNHFDSEEGFSSNHTSPARQNRSGGSQSQGTVLETGLHNIDADYSTETLKNMSYDELKTQPFEIQPIKPPNPLPTDPLNALPNLAAQMEFLLRKDQSFSNGDPEMLIAFFAQMSMREWEDAGEWFMSRFGEVFKKMKEARVVKRNLVREFEDEVAKYEEGVRGETAAIDNEMEDMLKSGEDVVKGRMKGSTSA